MPAMPTHHPDRAHDPDDLGDSDDHDEPVGASDRWRRAVTETVQRIAAERGIDHAPMPDVVAAALPGPVATVARLAEGMDEQNRQWLAALAALSTHVQLATLPNP